jgi:hypothetical protein
VSSQLLVLDGFPTVRQVALLGPNSGTFSPFKVDAVRQAIAGRVRLETIMQRTRPVRPPARLTLRYVVGDARARDRDNFALVGKPILDGLVRSEILAGDDAARLDLRVEFRVERGARRLEVVLETVDDDELERQAIAEQREGIADYYRELEDRDDEPT